MFEIKELLLLLSAKNFVKIGPAVPEICSWTDRHTHRQTDRSIPLLRSAPLPGRNNN